VLLILLCMDKDMEGRAAIRCQLTDIALCGLRMVRASIVLGHCGVALAAIATGHLREAALEV
jgi:hypothetical protein